MGVVQWRRQFWQHVVRESITPLQILLCIMWMSCVVVAMSLNVEPVQCEHTLKLPIQDRSSSNFPGYG